MKNILAFFFCLVCMFSCEPGGEELTIFAGKMVNMRVNAYTVECTGEMTGDCLLMQEGAEIGSDNWRWFYFAESIEGFTYEPGFIYDLVVRKTTIDNPPQDGSSVRYELVKVVRREKV